MSNPEIHFRNKTELLDWFKKNIPDSYSEYLSIQTKVKGVSLQGFGNLLKKESGESVENFLSFLTELNLANLFIAKEVNDVAYEPTPGFDVDFSFEGIDLSVKNLGTKNYEKVEYLEIEKLKESGGGKSNLTHKNFSNISMEVQKNSMGTFTYSRTEIGHNGFLDSDMSQMSIVLDNIGKFEAKIGNNGRKRVLFFLIHTPAFQHYHALDVAYWYFGKMPGGYQPIFNNDVSLYLKFLKQGNKLNNINALVFVFPPRPLIWPSASLGEVIEGKRRALIYANDENLLARLDSIFS